MLLGKRHSRAFLPLASKPNGSRISSIQMTLAWKQPLKFRLGIFSTRSVGFEAAHLSIITTRSVGFEVTRLIVYHNPKRQRGTGFFNVFACWRLPLADASGCETGSPSLTLRVVIK